MVNPTFVNCPGLGGRKRTVRRRAVRCSSAEQLGIGKGYTRAAMLVQKLQSNYPVLESMTPTAAECLAALLWDKKSSINLLVSLRSSQQRGESPMMVRIYLDLVEFSTSLEGARSGLSWKT
mmetsp:Transcript_20121/g.80901  ORF Transcript_20121/g.80901 Transcript_20121/m.80901 type:complete len:121 (-) Transcript_20121:2636-2998(-)